MATQRKMKLFVLVTKLPHQAYLAMLLLDFILFAQDQVGNHMKNANVFDPKVLTSYFTKDCYIFDNGFIVPPDCYLWHFARHYAPAAKSLSMLIDDRIDFMLEHKSPINAC